MPAYQPCRGGKSTRIQIDPPPDRWVSWPSKSRRLFEGDPYLMRALPACMMGLLLIVIGASGGRAGLTVTQSTDVARRTAVVIGNTNYLNMPRIETARQDARLVSEALLQIGVNVVFIANADAKTMGLLAAKLPLLFEPEGVGLFYYSGYGAFMDGVNYLLPTDSGINSKRQLAQTAIALKTLSGRAQLAGVTLQLLVLDANRQAGALSGLDGVEPSFSAPSLGEDFFVMLASAPGTVAGATADQTSPLATAFARAIGKTELSIADMFRDIRRQVRENTGGVQIPWASSSLGVSYILNPAAGPNGARGALITTCDLLAADPGDSERVAPPVGPDDVDAPAALRACELAVQAEPNNPRQLFQFARIVEIVGTPADALTLYQAAAALGYGAAIKHLTQIGAR